MNKLITISMIFLMGFATSNSFANTKVDMPTITVLSGEVEDNFEIYSEANTRWALQQLRGNMMADLNNMKRTGEVSLTTKAIVSIDAS
ncbi:MAG: hypothetical protein AAF197_08610 [Pseudomonadota bacterium]